MPIFKIENSKTKQLKTSNFKNEKALQDLVENNLEEIFGIKFIASELSTGEKHSGRIDTLGLDENNSPVIIEYKWGEKNNVMNQGLFYLDWLVDHKGDFQILAEKKIGKKIKIDWSQPRLILIASAFNRYDKYAINRMSENIELWTYSLYENGIFEVDIEGSSQASDKKGKRITKIEYAKYDLNYHLSKTSKDLQKMFNEAKEKILELPNVQERAEQKTGITYKTTKSFVHFGFHKTFIQVLVREPKYNDPKKIVRDITGFLWGYKGQIKIKPNSDIDYIFNLIKQSYEETL
jgi:predicted transport protein